MAIKLFTDTEVSTITNALRVAAERFKEHASAADFDGRLREQFERQQSEVLELADTLDQCDVLSMTTS